MSRAESDTCTGFAVVSKRSYTSNSPRICPSQYLPAMFICAAPGAEPAGRCLDYRIRSRLSFDWWWPVVLDSGTRGGEPDPSGSYGQEGGG